MQSEQMSSQMYIKVKKSVWIKNLNLHFFNIIFKDIWNHQIKLSTF